MEDHIDQEHKIGQYWEKISIGCQRVLEMFVVENQFQRIYFLTDKCASSQYDRLSNFSYFLFFFSVHQHSLLNFFVI